MEDCCRNCMLHFLLAFTADLVTLPAIDDFLSTALITPTATVCLMSHTAKWPRRGRKEEEVSGKWYRRKSLSPCLAQRRECFLLW